MSSSGLYQLIVNKGIQDQLLHDSDFLENRIKEIKQRKKAMNAENPIPSIEDIEETHIVFTKSHFKPHVRVALEYYTQQPAGSARLGTTVDFHIKEAGEFFHDMVLYMKLAQPTLSYSTSNESDKPLMRWCDRPGERAVSQARFSVGGNIIDSYTRFSSICERQFKVPEGKQKTHDRILGQEEAEVGFLDQPTWASSGVQQSSIHHRQSVETFSGLQTPSGQKTGDVELLCPLHFYFCKNVENSIPSLSISGTERFVYVDLEQANALCDLVPRGAGTYEDPLGSLDYTKMENIKKIQLFVNFIFVGTEVHETFLYNIAFDLVRIHLDKSFSVSTETPTINLGLKFPIEYLFFGVQPKDYQNISSDSLRRQHLDKWNKFTHCTEESRATQGWRQLKYSSVGSVSGALPSSATVTGASGDLVAVVGAAATDFADIYEGDVLTLDFGSESDFGSQTGVVLTVKDKEHYYDGSAHVSTLTCEETIQEAFGDVDLSSGGTLSGAVDATDVLRPSLQEATATVLTHERTVKKANLSAQDVILYKDFESKFYSEYLPTHFGKTTIRAPEDMGLNMMTFCLYPNSFQPSGHFNVSRTRELNLGLELEGIDSNSQGQLYVTGSAINFSLVADGSLIIRYAT